MLWTSRRRWSTSRSISSSKPTIAGAKPVGVGKVVFTDTNGNVRTAKAVAFAPAVGHDVWLRARPCWWMKSFPNSLCASGYWAFRTPYVSCLRAARPTTDERIEEYRKNKGTVIRKSTVFTQPVKAIHPARMTNFFRIPPSSQQKPCSPIADSTLSRQIPASGPSVAYRVCQGRSYICFE